MARLDLIHCSYGIHSFIIHQYSMHLQILQCLEKLDVVILNLHFVPLHVEGQRLMLPKRSIVADLAPVSHSLDQGGAEHPGKLEPG